MPLRRSLGIVIGARAAQRDALQQQAGVIHDAAHRGTSNLPVLKEELMEMIAAYLLKRRRRNRAARDAPSAPGSREGGKSNRKKH